VTMKDAVKAILESLMEDVNVVEDGESLEPAVMLAIGELYSALDQIRLAERV